ncbi:MAG TPA: 16S rRNA methyltransferase, partial [Gammaproteobacteria bacterium]|nr:16S rRNA methyltransferase [Gammaproteobacteria bacterium]
KNIQALRDLSEEDLSDDLLIQALDFAKKRVIVKRHKNSNYLNNQKPSFSIQGRVVRFDVYVTNSSH